MGSDPFRTQRDVGSAVVAELSAAGFADAEEIGRGGFGIVFRCTRVALDRVVAVKVLTAELDEDRERFVREQRAMGRLTGHPNIVGVLQVGATQSGYPYLVMQYHRHGSIDARIRRLGVLPVEKVLRLGVKLAGALESAHRQQIVHRDIKPSNVLLTDYDEPALSDFGIAHITGGFKTATGTFTGSPAFTAPEILSGDLPSQASDVYGLGATLFAALTGHAAYERRSGEQVVTQFLRIATEPAPDLRGSGIPDDVAAVVERAMSREPNDRPSAMGLGEELQRVQSRQGFRVDEMALRSGAQPDRAAARTVARRPPGSLPLELTSFVGRHADLAEAKRLLSVSRLLTLTGVGGVGKTRLALKAAAEAEPDFADGVRLVEIGDLRDAPLLVEVVAAGLGLRDESATSVRDVLVEFLCARRMLLVLDNCEQVVDEAAKLAETLLQACPELTILATSRERLGIGGESELRLSPLPVPASKPGRMRQGAMDSDAMTLFADRAAAAVPGFALTEDNEATVAQICSRVDGLPLAIELAAARLRTMSLDQILERLSDRYSLLTRGSRGAPTRQQTLAWSVGWSYDLCAPAERQLWGRLSVFAGSFELDAAEAVCGESVSEDVADLVSALVDKSILIPAECDGAVRFRLIDTLRDYGRQKVQQSGEYQEQRRRHLGWYRRLIADAAREWFSSRQLDWFKRLEAEGRNLREAMEFALADAPDIALELTTGLYRYAVARGRLSEMRHWVDRALAAVPPKPTTTRIHALYASTAIAGLQGDLTASALSAAEASSLVEQISDPLADGLTRTAEGLVALVSSDFARASACFESAVDVTDEPTVRVPAMMMLGWALEFRGELGRALIWQEKALSIAESTGELMTRSTVLWSIGVGWWRNGKTERAQQLLRECLKLTHLVGDPRTGASCLEALAWIARANADPRRAVVLMAAAAALGDWVGAPPAVLPDLFMFHEECERRAREALGVDEFEAAGRQGSAMDFDEAFDYALAELP